MEALLTVVCYTTVFSVVTQRSFSSRSFWGGALRDDTENGCVADKHCRGTLSLLLLAIKTVLQGTVVFLRGVVETIVGSLLFCAVAEFIQQIATIFQGLFKDHLLGI